MAIDHSICAEGEKTSADRRQERRARQRLAAGWPLHLWRPQEHAVEVLTTNLSSSGVYWISLQRFSAGEALTAMIEVGGPGTGREPHKLLLRCELVVLRVEELPERVAFGVACRIVDYSVRTL